METSTLQGYLFLCHFSTFPELKLSRLLKTFGNLDSMLTASNKEMEAFGVSGSVQKQLQNIHATAANHPEIEQALEWNEQENCTLICYEDVRYPRLLKEIDHSPPLLYVVGNTTLLSTNQLSIVGSRKASRYGLDNAFRFASGASNVGLTITSGMASGIDSQAHKGALVGSSSTVAVVGTGIDLCYPRSNRNLKTSIEKEGAIVSEFPLGSPPRAHHFPRRNRIITGLSLGVLVVEAASKSGSLISARTAMEQNREVFAIPGLVSNPLSAGCHRLIKEGAKLVTEIGDVTEELAGEFGEIAVTPESQRMSCSSNNSSSTKIESAVNGDQDKIISVLKTQSCLFDSLQSETKIDSNLLIDYLLELETVGTISLEAGRYHYRQKRKP